jgi:hypothetical protein
MGEAAWELSADPRSTAPVSLRVPVGEIDRSPEAPVEWVLFTLLDDRDRVVAVGGQVLA